jgi:NADH-quinone oxidoreductase subunit J
MNATELALGQAYFWVLAVIALAGAVFTVVAKNPIRGAMGLLLMILSIAGLFLALHAQFLAAIQLIVYAGAIVILFLFVIMLLGPSATPPHDKRGQITRTFGAGLFASGGIGAMWLLVRAAQSPAVVPPAVDNDFGGVDAFGRIVFSHGLVPFELSSALLMVAIIGAVAVARGRETSAAREARAQTPTAHAPARPMEPKAYP